MKQNRFKSPVLWLGILAQLCMIVTIFNPALSEQIKIFGGAVLEILTLVGIINNPTDSEKW